MHWNYKARKCHKSVLVLTNFDIQTHIPWALPSSFFYHCVNLQLSIDPYQKILDKMKFVLYIGVGTLISQIWQLSFQHRQFIDIPTHTSPLKQHWILLSTSELTVLCFHISFEWKKSFCFFFWSFVRPKMRRSPKNVHTLPMVKFIIL